ncbi:MAG: tetratricopeptide repeat protein, partial [Flavobacteriales bacterium]|nr:tetratricopeptide repeat protein [Flavobacteriales bacterium]
PDVPAWLAVMAGVAFASALVALPFATHARREVFLMVLPVINGTFLVFLLIRWVLRRKGFNSAELPLIFRSVILFVVLAFLSYMPPNALYRSVIIALNRGNERLIANMRMVEEFAAFQLAYERGDCAKALEHATRSNEYGLVWLYGKSPPEPAPGANSTTIKLNDSLLVKLDPIMRAIQDEHQQELWKISRTYDNLYVAHRCLAENATSASDPQLAFDHYRQGDSLLNVIKDRTDGWAEERIWSLSNVAQAASNIGEYALADSLFSVSLDVYKEIKDSVDADAADIIADWASSLSDREQWAYSNLMLRTSIGLSEPDDPDKAKDTRWIKHRLQLIKNLITTDSLALAERTLEPCLGTTHGDSTLQCRVLIAQGALQYKLNAFRSADTTLRQAMTCLSALSNNDEAKAVALVSWGYVKTALADYAEARKLVEQGQALFPAARGGSLAGGLLQLSALIHHLQGHYDSAMREYEQSLSVLAKSPRGGWRTPGALAGLAEVLLDLAEPARAKILADSALALVTDSLPDILPGQASTLNTAAYADYCLNDLARAQVRYAITLSVCSRYNATNITTYAQALNGMGLVAMALSKTQTADSLLTQAYNTSLAIHGREHPTTARILINQAQLRMQQRRPAEAQQLLLIALPISEHFLGKDHDQLADIHVALGDIEQGSRNNAAAEAHYREALRIYKVCFPANHPKISSLVRSSGLQ